MYEYLHQRMVDEPVIRGKSTEVTPTFQPEVSSELRAGNAGEKAQLSTRMAKKQTPCVKQALPPILHHNPPYSCFKLEVR